MFETTSNLHMFWIKVKTEYSKIFTNELKSLLPFSTSCLCETWFSTMTAIKMQLQSRLDISNTLQVSLSSIIQLDGTIQLQENKPRAPTDSALLLVVQLFHYISKCNNNRNKVQNKCNVLEASPNHLTLYPGLWKNYLP